MKIYLLALCLACLSACSPSPESKNVNVEAPKQDTAVVQKTEVELANEKSLAELNKYLAERGLQLCSVVQEMDAMMKEAHRKADQKFAISDEKNHDYASELIEKGTLAFCKKHNVDRDHLLMTRLFKSECQ